MKIKRDQYETVLSESFSFKEMNEIEELKRKLYELAEMTNYNISYWFDHKEAPIFWNKDKDGEYKPKFSTCVNAVSKNNKSFLLTPCTNSTKENIEDCINFLKEKL